MPKGENILHTEYNGWWTTLNTIRTTWDKPGSATTVTTVAKGTKATATDINKLINSVNELKNYYSDSVWDTYTESTKAVGDLIQYPEKMTYMLNYLQTVCAYDSTYTNESYESTWGNNGTDGTYGNDGVCDTNSTVTTCSTDTTCETNSTQSNYSTNCTENGGKSVAIGGPDCCYNNGTCDAY